MSRVQSLIDGESERLQLFRERPVLASPLTVVDSYAEDVLRLVQRGVDVTDTLVEMARTRLDGLRASVRALSPQSTLDRGYAIVQDKDGGLVDSTEEVAAGDVLRIRVRDGDIGAVVDDS
jgi:exodeoxyribonuclease VII large subunit